MKSPSMLSINGIRTSAHVLAAIAVSFSASVGFAASFRGLGDLPGGDFLSAVPSISADGSVVVGRSISDGGEEAFHWTEATGMVGLGGPGGAGFNSVAWGVSSDGSVIAGQGNPGGANPHFEAFRWTAEMGVTFLGDFPGGEVISAAHSVSGDGSIIVGVGRVAGADHAFRWTAADGLIDLGTLPNHRESHALRISADGAVIVGVSRTHRPDIADFEGEAFRRTESTGMVGLGHLHGLTGYSLATGVSADGSVVVGSSAELRELGIAIPRAEAFRWTEDEGMVGLGILPGYEASHAIATSADGAWVVGQSYDLIGNPSRAFIWNDNLGMQDLQQVLVRSGIDLSGWSLLAARGISADGSMIVGDGINPAGMREAWLATVDLTAIPEPSAAVLLLVGGVLLVVARRGLRFYCFQPVSCEKN